MYSAYAADIPLSHIITELTLICSITLMSGAKLCCWYPTQSHYPDTELTRIWSIILMSGVKLWNDRFY